MLYLKKILRYRFDDFFGKKRNPHPLILGRTPPELHYLQIIEYLKVTYEPTEKSPMLHVYLISVNASGDSPLRPNPENTRIVGCQ